MFLWFLAPLSAQGTGGEDCASAEVIGTIPFFATGNT
jgi:hypothetical protein